MKSNRIRSAVAAVAATACVAALVGIATGAAAPSHHSNRAKSTQRSRGAMPFPGPPGGPPGALLRRGAGASSSARPGPPFGGPPVHSEMVVPTKSGDSFETITQDSGKVDSVSGNQLSITEGTKQATYKTVTLDIPGDAKVIRNGKTVALSDLQQGDFVHVSQSPEDSFVFATDASFKPKFGRPGPPPPGAAGMPPGLPPMAASGRQRRY